MEIAGHDDLNTFRISSKIKLPNLRALLTSIGHQLSQLLNTQRVGIYLKGRESGNWALAISRDFPPALEQHAAIINQDQSEKLTEALNSMQPCLLVEVLSVNDGAREGFENVLVAPMKFGDEIMGLLLTDFDAFAMLSDKHLIQLSLAAQLIKVAIEREFLAMQVARLEKESVIASMPDPQKMLYSDQFVHWFLDIEIERAVRHGSKFAVLIIGIDNLAHLISQHSSSVIEQYTGMLSESLNRLVRKCDLLVRRGSNEFLLITMEQNEAGAMVIAEKLRHRAKETTLTVQDQVLASTMSIGVALSPNRDEKVTPKDLILRAEIALKIAMGRGNRVRIWKSDETD